MDKNTKIAFGVCGAIWLWGMYKQYLMYKTLVDIEECLDAIANKFEQEEVDNKFEDIAEEIGDIGQFPDDS